MTFDEVIDRRASESYKWREYPEDVLPLFVADMDFRSPEPVVRALRSYIEDGVFGYPRGLHTYDRAQVHELAGLIVDRMAQRYHWRIAADDIVFIPGVVAGLNMACRAAGAGSVLVQPPVYPPILAAPANADLERVESPLHCENDGSYSIDWSSFGSGVARNARLFLLCNPHNPAGRVFRRGELEKMAEICLSANVTICADEIHGDLLFEDHQHIPIASLDPEIARRTITLIAPSKTFNLAGLQCAFAIIPDSELRRQFRSAGKGLVPWVNPMGLIGAEAAYRDGQAWLDELLPYLQANRDFLWDFVNRELPGIKTTKPEGTYLAWLDCRELKLDNPYEFFLKHARVALSDGRTFGAEGTGFVRLNFGCPRSILKEALSRMKSSLNALQQP
ncbi:MAG TPA: MalY/PatB family protein [Bryobacteraceae bacterium]|nr:MalY/PatB family protein [Bryobacteraceae bacterium]